MATISVIIGIVKTFKTVLALGTYWSTQYGSKPGMFGPKTYV